MQIKNFTPLRDQIVVIAEPKNDHITESGLHLIDSQRSKDRKPQRGVVIAVGDGVVVKRDGTTEPIELEVGDIVLFHTTSGINIPKDEKDTDMKDYRIMRLEDVLAITVK